MNYDLVFICMVGLAVNAAILYLVIAAATKSSQRAKYDWAQLELMARIARAQGVKEEEIAGIFQAIK